MYKIKQLFKIKCYKFMKIYIFFNLNYPIYYFEYFNALFVVTHPQLEYSFK